jgi:hypothetical protein
MPKKALLTEFSALLKQLTAAVVEAAWSVQARSWQEALLDVRSAPDGGSRTLKLRITLRSGGTRSVATAGPIDSLVLRVFHSKDAVFSPTWYGLKLVVTGAGQCDISYNCDPHCEEDDAFYAD